MGLSSARTALFAGLVITLVATPLFAQATHAPQQLELRLKLAEFDPLEGLPELPDRLRLGHEPDAGYFVAQFMRPVDPGLLDTVRATGAAALQYMPDQSYILYLPATGADLKSALRSLPEVRWLGAIEPGWKIAPDLGIRPYDDDARRIDGKYYATIDLFPGEDLDQTAGELSGLGIELLGRHAFSSTLRFNVQATMEQLELAARLQAVSWIEETAEITSRNNAASWVVQSDVVNQTTIWDHGLHGEGQIVGHIDSRIDMNSCYFEDPLESSPGPNHRKVVAYRSNAGLGAVSHGTHTAGTSAGNSFPINGSLNNAGQAYEARLSHSNLNDISGFGGGASNLYTYFSSAHQDGARVHTNSWGDDGTTAYTNWSRDIDLFSYDFEDSLVLFAVTNTGSLRTPENAKNVLAVGASQNGTSNDSLCSGGAGPTSDGRRKPEIFAPGCSIVSARNSVACSTRSLTGTSMACPAVTGAGALVRQYFEDGWYPLGAPLQANSLVPSGALVKAVMLNSAVDMTSYSTFPPNNQEGWGRTLLDNGLHFAGDTRTLAVLTDLRNANGLSTGGELPFVLEVSGDAEDLEITLVFTEPAAASQAASATINNLDLEVMSPSGTLYLGNVYSSGVSVVGGSADPINNVEGVRIASPEIGVWTATVKGTAVNQGTQGFALAATGQLTLVGGGGTLRYASHGISDDGPLANNNGIIDPGETVTLPLTLLNLRTSDATAISGLLLPESGDEIRITLDTAVFQEAGPTSTTASLAPHYQLTMAPDAGCGTTVPLTVKATYTDGSDVSLFDISAGQNELVSAAADVPIVIPKKTLTPVISSVEIMESVTPNDFDVEVHIDHADVSEIVVTLVSPSGTRVVLHDQSGSGADIHTVYDNQTQPDGPGSMSDFIGEPTSGTWTLEVQDLERGAGQQGTPEGTLEEWTLMLDTSQNPFCDPLDCGGDPVPGEVAPTMTVTIDGSDLEIDWPAVGGASAYRVWRSTSREFSEQRFAGSSSGTSFVVTDGLNDPEPLLLFQVRAINSCNWEGP